MASKSLGFVLCASQNPDIERLGLRRLGQAEPCKVVAGSKLVLCYPTARS